MKIEPLDILLNEDFIPNTKLYLVSGNEVTLIQKVSEILIEKYKKKKYRNITNKHYRFC